ncbi:MAG TPA: hypothetical protein PK358_17770, partial [Spirochaetota bacterium]|nr:hypothetical protein [Spirochaetota bacterium]
AVVTISVVTALSGAIVAYFVFGGATGARLDLNIITVMNAGYKLFTSSFIVRLPANFADKGISILIACLLIRILKPEYKGNAVKN